VLVILDLGFWPDYTRYIMMINVAKWKFLKNTPTYLDRFRCRIISNITLSKQILS